MKTHSSPLWRGLFFALLFVALAYIVNGATSGSKVSSAAKQLKRQFNDDLLHSSSSKQEASRQISASAASASNPSEKSNQQKQQEQQSAIPSDQRVQEVQSSVQSSVQPAAEKKQGDSVAAAQDIFGSDEYVQIKPEEITVNENGKEIAPASGASSTINQQQQQQQQLDQQVASAPGEQQQQQSLNGAEHKSVDDELNAHLALDAISQQESTAYHSYSPLMQSRPQPAPVQRAVYPPPAPYKVAPRPLVPATAGYQPPAPAQRGPRSPPRLPPSYITLKGKLTGINSIISQYPHPAPGYPHQGPRHLPRGAAAGYAAFRDFVRAHASKYKHASGPQQQQVSAPGGYAGEQQHRGYERPKELAAGYNQAPKSPLSYEAPRQAKRAPIKTKVTVAQAYIPNLSTPAAAPASYGAGQSTSAGYTNPVLAKLYGGHAPQGIGKPEYSKDYGMVIHYPQATVYTEPMTVDQLHKLTGAGISQVLEQLQYNFAHGQRDESNTLRANNKHHIGNGVTIHAKEYYAPGKSGQYVPTTAAVISTSAQQSAYDAPAASYEGPSSDYNQNNGAQKAVELGTGYERVKQAASSGQQKYNNRHTNSYAANEYPQQQPQQQYNAAPSGSYEQPSGSRYGNGEPLSAITSFIGSELEALYKANAALTKQIEPEIYSQIQAYKSSNKANAPLRYNDIQPRPYSSGSAGGYGAPATGAGPYSGPQLGGGQYSAGGAQPAANKYAGQPQQHQRARPGYPRRPNGGAKGNRHYRQSQRPSNPYSNRQPAQSGYGNRPQQVQVSSYQQQAAAYKATEQALEQQMMQLLQDFRTGDEHYNSKSQPSHAINQGYPNKVMQKYNQQPQQHQQPQQQYQSPGYANQQQQNQHASSAYAHHDGLEIPQGPNDQIGEIADLIEALKGSLDLQKPESAGDSYGAPKQAARQLEDVRYLTSALGQAPSYAIQVPVANGESTSYESSGKKGADNGYQQQQQQHQHQQEPAHYIAAPQNNGPAPVAYNKQPQASGPAYQPSGPDGGAYGAPAHLPAPVQNYNGPAQQAVEAPQSYQQQQPVSSYGPAQEPAGYQQQHQQQQPDSYQQAAQAEYGGSAQQQHQQVEPAGQSGYAQPVAAAPVEQQPASGYEHSQVINHLVPVTTSSIAASQPAQSGYTQAGHSSQPQQAPVSQIAIAAPTESQYQQAQSLSSFVDSLATDYQELLRQPSPALLDATSGAAAQLAVPANQESSSSYGSNATAPAESSYDNAASSSQQVASSTSSQATSGQQSAYQPQQQQQQQPAQTKSHSSASGSSTGQQQYKKAAA